jgi:hypothetical protein
MCVCVCGDNVIHQAASDQSVISQWSNPRGTDRVYGS